MFSLRHLPFSVDPSFNVRFCTLRVCEERWTFFNYGNFLIKDTGKIWDTKKRIQADKDD